MPLTYRHATAADLPFIVGLIVADSVVATGDDPAAADGPDYAAAFAAIDADPNQELLVAEFDGTPVGTFQLTYIPGLQRRGMKRALVESVHVAPAQRNRGFGGEMMRWAAARCRERGCGLMQLTSNKQRTDAHRFYRRLGFEQSHEGFKLLL
ncbi:GNAT family N-acetyltransferase [Devosia sp.]|uniref:GNAT family N-acetyltransferase n=1 Tax=Devosia sp. TaxID=1871048 RepID=UPI002F1C6AB5